MIPAPTMKSKGKKMMKAECSNDELKGKLLAIHHSAFILHHFF
jgi:hypothetical protein